MSDTPLKVWKPGEESRLELCISCEFNSAIEKNHPMCSRQHESPCQTASRIKSPAAGCPHTNPEYSARWKIAATADISDCERIHPQLGIELPEQGIEFPPEFDEDDTLIGRVKEKPTPVATSPTPTSPPKKVEPIMRNLSAEQRKKFTVYKDALRNMAKKHAVPVPAPTLDLGVAVHSYPMPNSGSMFVVATSPVDSAVCGFLWGHLKAINSIFTFDLAGGHVIMRKRGVLRRMHEYVFQTLGADRIWIHGDRPYNERSFMVTVGYRRDSDEDPHHMELRKEDFQSYLNSRDA